MIISPRNWNKTGKQLTENEMVRWHHRFNGYEFEQHQEVVKDREACSAGVHRVTKSWHDLATQQQHDFICHEIVTLMSPLRGQPSSDVYWASPGWITHSCTSSFLLVKWRTQAKGIPWVGQISPRIWACGASHWQWSLYHPSPPGIKEGDGAVS